jgi:hypothetical protein
MMMFFTLFACGWIFFTNELFAKDKKQKECLISELVHEKSIFIGNSVLASALDLKKVTKETNLKAVFVGATGTYSDMYLLIIKNCLVKKKSYPKNLFLFFYENNLTRVFHGEQFYDADRYQKTLARFGGEHDPILQKTYSRNANQYYDLQFFEKVKEQIPLKKKLDQLIKDLSFSFFEKTGQSRVELNKQLNSPYTFFGRKSDFIQSPTSKNLNYNFDDYVENSFFPYLLQNLGHLKEKTKIYFIRSLSLKDSTPQKDQYFSKLRAQIENSGFQYVDLNHLIKDPKSFIADNAGHILPEKKNELTEQFLKQVMKRDGN